MKHLLIASCLLLSCAKMEQKPPVIKNIDELKASVEKFADVEINVDLSHLSEKQIKLIYKLVEAGQYADNIFWKQTSHDALKLRTELEKHSDESSKIALEFLNINYGPFGRLEEEKRMVGEGDSSRYHGGAFYPEGMKKEEFEAYLNEHSDQAEVLKGQYSIIVRDGKNFKAIPYHEFYKEDVVPLAKHLREAAELADNPSLKTYLTTRASAIETDDYYESDVKWMQLENNDIDVVIGPIENYEDGLFNYRTAYEVAVMVKDPKGTKDLEMFKAEIDNLEKNLPSESKYHRESAGKGNVLEVVNIVYFGGDFQSGVKTIAASLPNDPNVQNQFGGKKQMYKNLMAAKYRKMVIPISERLLAPESRQYIDENAFTTFITMHEVSHTLGNGFVHGKENMKVREALKEKYSPIEEAKADVIGLYNTAFFNRKGVYSEEDMKKFYVTYLAGLFRSIRFGATEAHGQANIAQMVFLKEQGALSRNAEGYWVVHFDKMHNGISKLGRELLHIQAEGSYQKAVAFLQTYGKLTEDIQADIDKLKNIPSDLDTHYAVLKSKTMN